MDDRVTRAKEILGLRRLPIKIGFLDAPPPSAGALVGRAGRRRLRVLGPRDGGQELLHAARRSLELRHRQPHPQDRAAGRSRQRAAGDDRVHGRDALPRPRRGARASRRWTARRRRSPTRPPPATRSRPTSCCWRVTPAQSTLVFEAALKAGIAQRRGRRHQPPELRDPARVRQDRGRRDLVRLQGQPDLHHRRRRRDVRRDPGRALGRLRRSPDRGAALEPDDGQLLPGAGGEVLRAEVTAARRASRWRARRAVGGRGAGGGARARASRWSASRAAERAGSASRSSAGWRPATPPTWTWMARRLPERLDPTAVLAGRAHGDRAGDRLPPPAPARPAPIARYARGRDYHYAHRDRMKDSAQAAAGARPDARDLRLASTPASRWRRSWAERAGLGWIGKNGCLINPRLGSWLTLSVMFVDRAVDAYDAPAEQPLRRLHALPAAPVRPGAFAAPGVVDARRCISYQSIENQDVVPPPLRARLRRAHLRLRRLPGGLPVEPPPAARG